MSVSDNFKEGCIFIGRNLWIILIPIALDLADLLSWEKLYHTVYHPAQKLFILKFGFIGAPPSLNYLFEDFPTPLFKYDNYGLSGIINSLSLFNAALFLSVLLITSFLHSGYMSAISKSSEEKVLIKDFFINGNRKWYKFFIMDCIIWIPLILMVLDRTFIILAFANVIFVYVKYSFVTDEVGICENFRLGIAFLFNNLGLSIKMALYFGLIFSLLSVVMFPLSSLGSMGMLMDIVICAYFGGSINKALLEVYAEEGRYPDIKAL